MKHRKHKRSRRRNYSHWIPAYSNPRRSRLGSGIRFRQLSAKLASRRYKTGSRKGQRYTTDPRALAAWIGRKKYGKKRFQKMAATGLRRAIRRAHGHRPHRHAFVHVRRIAANKRRHGHRTRSKFTRRACRAWKRASNPRRRSHRR